MSAAKSSAAARWVPLVAAAAVGIRALLSLSRRNRRQRISWFPPKVESHEQRLARLAGLRNVPLAPAFVGVLRTPEVQEWREAYRSYRLGNSDGAEGESKDLFKRFPNYHDASKARQSAAALELPDMDSSTADGSDTAGPSVDTSGGGSWDALERAQALISEYRLAYRRHRVGAAVGAKGELGDLVRAMDAKALRLLPAAQLANLRRSQLLNREHAESGMMTRSLSMARLSSGTPVEPGTDPRFHVHLGAGKLGMGLVVPAVAASGCAFAVVQRPSRPALDALLDQPPCLEEGRAGAVHFTANGEPYAEVAFVRCLHELPSAWRGWLEERARVSLGGGFGFQAGRRVVPPPDLTPKGLLVCSTEDALLDLLVGAASSFSTSLGPGVAGVPKTLTAARVPPREAARQGDRPALFAGENDHAAVDALAEALQGRVDVVSCMVDRICTTREVSEAGIEVGAEQYRGSIVVLTPPPHVAAPPFVGKNVLVPRASSEADYLCGRKLLMVNGSHTTLAFLSLVHARTAQATSQTDLAKLPRLVGDKLPAPHKDLALLNLGQDMNEAERVTMWAFAVARTLLLLFEWDLEVIKSAHGLTADRFDSDGDSDAALVDLLVASATETLHRFDDAPDTCGRVLGGGVKNRFKGRLLPVKSFLDDMAEELKRQQRNQLRARLKTLGGGGGGASTPRKANKSRSETANRRGLAQLVLERAGMDLPTLQEVVSGLTNKAKLLAEGSGSSASANAATPSS